MTNDEAIAIIRNEYKCVDRDCDIEKSCGKCDLMMPSKEPILEAYKLAIKALEQHTCEDEYIKVPKKALKYRTAGMVAYNAEWLKKHWQMELKVMGIECDDAISCEAVIEWLKAKDIIKLSSQEETARKELKALPPVTPQQKYEKWIDYREDGFVECPFCGHATNCEDDIDELHYCFYCGARMVEPQESSEDELKDLSKRVETLEKQMKEDKEEQLRKLKAELDYAKFRCTL